jgi:GT2 family glycosyltransferase
MNREMSLSRPVTIIMLTWNGLEYTRECLRTLKAHTPIGDSCQVFVVDNGSTDGTAEFLEGLEWITLFRNGRNLGFAGGNNVGIRAAPPKNDLVLINNDLVFVQDDWLQRMQAVAHSAPDVGIVGCRLIMPNGLLLHAGTYMPTNSFIGQQIGSNEKEIDQYNADREVEGVVFACVYIRRETLAKVGLLDEAYTSYFEDTDYCLKAQQKGFKTICAGRVTVIHHENVSHKVNVYDFSGTRAASRRTFIRRWKHHFRRDLGPTVFWHCSPRTTAEYATYSRQLVLFLDDQDVDIRLQRLYAFDEWDGRRDNFKMTMMRHRPRGGRMPHIVFGPAETFVERSGDYTIGYTMTETDALPEPCAKHANQIDEVWVTSEFSRRALLNSGVQRPVRVMPLGIDPDYFNPRIRAFRPTQRYTFLSLTGHTRWPIDVLLRAYCETFSAQDDVLLLVLMMGSRADLPRRIKALGLPKDAPPVGLLHAQRLPGYQLGALYRSTDCFVLPTRGEGWGTPILQAMACGLPVIATDWGGHTDYMSARVSYPLRVATLTPAGSGAGRWAEPDGEHLRELLWHVYGHREEAQQRGLAAAETILSHWTWRHAAQRIKDRLLEIKI